MKQYIIFFITAALVASCQNPVERYATKGPEIDLVKSLLDDYHKGDWDGWTSHYADTAKIHHNSPESISQTPGEVKEALQTLLSGVSSYKFRDDNLYYEKVIDDDGEIWVNFWGEWEGTLSAANKELVIPVHLTMQIADGKIQEEFGMYNLSEYVAEMQAIAAKDALPADQKIIDGQLDDFVNKFFNKRDPSVLGNIMADNYTRYMNGVKVASNPKEFGEVFSNTFVKAFPDMKLSNSERVYSGNKVYVHWNFAGTNTGEFNGAAPTGNKVSIAGLSELQFNKDGKLFLEKVYFNELDMLNQISGTSTEAE